MYEWAVVRLCKRAKTGRQTGKRMMRYTSGCKVSAGWMLEKSECREHDCITSRTLKESPVGCEKTHGAGTACVSDHTG